MSGFAEGTLEAAEMPNSIKRNRNFRFFVLSGSISGLGEQFTLVAFPWLVLSLVNEPWILGLLMGLVGLPKAIFILFGGAIVDRFSSRIVMLSAKAVSAVALLILASLTIKQSLDIVTLCILLFVTGICSAFTMPARVTLLHLIVRSGDIEKANSFLVVVGQLLLVLGPLLAGVILGAGTESIADDRWKTYALGILIGLDGLANVFSVLILLRVTYSQPRSQSISRNVFRSIYDGFLFFWSNIALRMVTLYIVLTGCIVGGLIQIGLPIFIKEVLLGREDSYGYFLSVAGVGTALGALLSSRFSNIGRLSLGVRFLLVDAIIGVLIIVFGVLESYSAALVVVLLIGGLRGYIHVSVVSWVQKQAVQEVRGRVMSIVIFVMVGLAPIFAAFFGLMLTIISAKSLFLLSGAAVCALATLGLTSTSLRSVVRQ